MTIVTNPKLRKKLEEKKFEEEHLCEANKLLLKRMQSNPDEFHLMKGGRWADYFNMIYTRLNEGDPRTLVMLSNDECAFMWDRFVEVSKGNLHKNFMQRLLNDEQMEDDGQAKLRFSTVGRYSP
jgi:hypothetical protein